MTQPDPHPHSHSQPHPSFSAIEDVVVEPPSRSPVSTIDPLMVVAFLLGIGLVAGLTALIPKHAGHSKMATVPGLLIVVWLLACMLPFTKKYAGFPFLMVLAPLVVRRSRFAFPGTITRVDRPPAQVPLESVEAMARYRADLERIGFRSKGLLLMTGPSFTRPGHPARAVIEPYENGAGRTAIVMLTVASLPPRDNPPILRFKDRTRTGRWILTVNSRTAGMFPHRDDHDAVVLPGVTDAARMFTVHQAMLRRFAPASALQPVPQGSWEEELVLENLQTRDLWIKHKFIEETDGGEYKVATGHLLPVSWGFAFPLKNIRESAMRRRNRRRLEELAL